MEVRTMLAAEIEAGRGRVLDAELKQKMDAWVSSVSSPAPPSSPASVSLPTPPSSPPPLAFTAPAPAPSPAPGGGEARRQQMAALVARAEACTRCGLHVTRNRVVTGVGDLDSPLMLVGEAPGHEEDQTGEPFVGRAGQLLNRILAAIELDRRQVYIANVIKCRPPENRNPAPAEIATCSPFLFEQIELVQPQVICALGRFAAATLLRTNQSLAALRGRVHDYRGIPVVVTYHPSALLRYPAYKRPTWEDMQVVQRLLAGVAAPAVTAGIKD